MVKKEIDGNLYNEKSLYLLNIRELRDMGRKFGVPSPTTMKKRDLVDYILKVVYGEIEPPVRNICGRPNSREFDMGKYIDKIKKNSDLTNELKEYRLDDYIVDGKFVVKAASPRDSSSIGDIEQRVVFRDKDVCSLRVRQFVESSDDVEIDCKIADKLGLENFDVVEVIIADCGVKIISKNGKKIANNIKPFRIADENILAGTRKVFHLRTKEEIKEEIYNIMFECKTQDIEVVYFGHGKLNEKNIRFFEPASDDVQNYKNFMMFIEYCKKLVYENQDFVVLIEDMTEVESIVDSLEYEISQRFRKYLGNEMYDFVKLGNVAITFHQLKTRSYFNWAFSIMNESKSIDSTKSRGKKLAVLKST